MDGHVHRPARGHPLGLTGEAASTIPACAGVSKLAAEMDSKSIAGNRVRVRVPPPALAFSWAKKQFRLHESMACNLKCATATRVLILCRIPPLPHSLAQDDGQ